MADLRHTGDYLDLIQQLVTGDHEAYRRRCASLDRTGWEGLGLVVGAAFYRAVHGRFAGTRARTDPAVDIIRFVADARAHLAGTGFDVDPAVGESLVRAALVGTGEPIEDLEPPVVVQTELLLLARMLAPMTPAELRDFLHESGSLAEQWGRQDAAETGPGRSGDLPAPGGRSALD